MSQRHLNEMIEFAKQWDDPDSSPLEDIYRAAMVTSGSYSDKKEWALKLSKYLRGKKGAKKK